MAIVEIYQSFKNRFDEALLTPTGRVIVILAIAFVTATFIFGLLIYSFSRPPAKKPAQIPSANLQTLVTPPPTPTEATTLPNFYTNASIPTVLAAVEKDTKLLEANNLEGLYDNLAESVKRNISYQTFNALFLAKFGSDFKIISARRSSDPVFVNNAVQVNIIITYQVGQSTKQLRNTFHYISENGTWKLNLIT